MTQDFQQQIRDRYIGEYIADAGAKKPGILGKIWRSAKSIKEHLDAVKKVDPQAHALIYVGAVVMMMAAFGGSPFVATVLLGAGASYVGGLIRANIDVRREATDAITRDIDDGKLDARFKADTQSKTAPETQPSTMPAGGQATAQFTSCAECAAPEAEQQAEPLPPVRGIERPHGRNFG